MLTYLFIYKFAILGVKWVDIVKQGLSMVTASIQALPDYPLKKQVEMLHGFITWGYLGTVVVVLNFHEDTDMVML